MRNSQSFNHEKQFKNLEKTYDIEEKFKNRKKKLKTEKSFSTSGNTSPDSSFYFSALGN